MKFEEKDLLGLGFVLNKSKDYYCLDLVLDGYAVELCISKKRVFINFYTIITEFTTFILDLHNIKTVENLKDWYKLTTGKELEEV